MSAVDVSVIIVSYNTRDLTVACCRSIFENTTGCAPEVILIDNNSTDGTVEAVRGEFPQARLIANTDNKGFAAANNQGLEIATGDYLLLLNPDTELRGDTLTDTLAYAKAHPEAGVIGCRCYGDDGEQQSTLFRNKRVIDVAMNSILPNRIMRKTKLFGRSRYSGIDLDREHDVEVVAGCFMFVPRKAFEEVGGMDEDFFMYGEESEWCWRFRQHGWKVRYFPGASILHYGGVSTDRHPSQMNLAMARSNLLLVQKTQGRLAAYLANFFMLLRDIPRSIAWWFVRLRRSAPDSPVAGALRRASQRCGLHFRGLARLDWRPRA